MGWSSGSEIACYMAKAIKREVKDKDSRKRLYIALVKGLELHDWDTKDEAEGIDPILDEVLFKSQQ